MGNSRAKKPPPRAWEKVKKLRNEKGSVVKSTKLQAQDNMGESDKTSADEVEKSESLSEKKASSIHHTKSQKSSSSGASKPDIQTFASSVRIPLTC